LKETGKVIEFYGDYWHCNPTIYNESRIIKIGNEYKKVTDVWNDDKLRIEYVKKIPYIKDVLIVWQQDYNNNPDFIVEKCLKFLIG
jgi:hypothetical protein